MKRNLTRKKKVIKEKIKNQQKRKKQTNARLSVLALLFCLDHHLLLSFDWKRTKNILSRPCYFGIVDKISHPMSLQRFYLFMVFFIESIWNWTRCEWLLCSATTATVWNTYGDNDLNIFDFGIHQTANWYKPNISCFFFLLSRIELDFVSTEWH